MDRRAWHVTVLRTAESWTGLKRLSRQTDGKFSYLGLPRWLGGSESACQGRRLKRHQFDPWVGNIPWKQA